MASMHEIGNERVWLASATEAPVESEAQATELIGDALAQGATVLALPVERLHADFFRLRSGLAGAIAQKAVNYRLKLAVVGDISAQVAASEALRDWVRESANQRSAVRFLASLDELATPAA